MGCGSTSKTVGAMEKAKALDAMVANRSFEIVADWAYPQVTSAMNSISNSGILGPGNTTSRIDLMGSGNYLKMQGDTVSAFLPYFGERQMGGGFGANSGIEFKGIPNDLEITPNTKDQSYRITFNIRDQSESYNLNMMLYPDLSSRINVTSSQRNYIRYEGRVAALKENDWGDKMILDNLFPKILFDIRDL